jgi:hypothetical protein
MLASEFWFQLVVVLILKETLMSLELFVPKYCSKNLPTACGLCVFICMYFSHLSVYIITVKIPLTLGCVHRPFLNIVSFVKTLGHLFVSLCDSSTAVGSSCVQVIK